MRVNLLCAMAAAIAVMGEAPAWGAAGTQTALWSFTGGADGNQPRGDILIGANGLLYGTASSGGINQCGTVFQIKPTGTKSEQTLYQFTCGADGSLPTAGLIADASGALYGTAALDGANSLGTVFRITPPVAGQTAWTETTLWSFTGGIDGGQPVGSLIADRSGSGVLYGTTSFGGTAGLGTVFSLTPPSSGQTTWTEQTLWSFTGGADGAKPVAALAQRNDGVLFGTAEAGGSSNAGTVFELAPPAGNGKPWTFTTIWSFTGGADGASPTDTLTINQSKLYGTAEYGGNPVCGQSNYPYYGMPASETVASLGAGYVPPGGNGCGVVFTLTPSGSAGQPWTQSVIWAFKGLDDGANPVAGVVVDSAGAVHGGTIMYGESVPDALGQFPDKGTVFTLSPPTTGGAPYSESTDVAFMFQKRGDYIRSGLAHAGNKFYGTQVFGGKYWQHVKVYGYGTVISVQ